MGKVFYSIGKDGKPTDRGIADEPLMDEDLVRTQLIREGVITEFIFEPIEKGSK